MGCMPTPRPLSDRFVGLLREARWPMAFAALALASVPAPVALGLGMLAASRIEPEARLRLARLASFVLSASLVAVGFGQSLAVLAHVGLVGLSASSLTLGLSLGLGRLLGRGFGIEPKVATLVAAGTGICGGSAIAALAPVVRAERAQITPALLVVFAMNAVASFVVPSVGTLLGLDPEHAGWLVALAVHDTASVAYAASGFGAVALAVATTVKLARTAYLVPVALVLGTREGKDAATPVPRALFAFAAASAVVTFVPGASDALAFLPSVGRVGFGLALGLVGASADPAAFRALTPRLVGYAAVLWASVLLVAALLVAYVVR